jgi:hypothetical protein
LVSRIPLHPLWRERFALVDDEDIERVSQRKWWVTGGKYQYVYTQKRVGGKQVNTYLHRLIMGVDGATRRVLVDHVNGDTLDNRRANLRLCDKTRNGYNRGSDVNTSSQYKGVSWRKDTAKWVAQITAEGQHYGLGAFIDEVDAAKAYDEAARRLHGEFAYLNCP